jgi:hypothetical protein
MIRRIFKEGDRIWMCDILIYHNKKNLLLYKSPAYRYFKPILCCAKKVKIFEKDFICLFTPKGCGVGFYEEENIFNNYKDCLKKSNKILIEALSKTRKKQKKK